MYFWLLVADDAALLKTMPLLMGTTREHSRTLNFVHCTQSNDVSLPTVAKRMMSVDKRSKQGKRVN